MAFDMSTPSSLSQRYLSRFSPLPEFSWADAREVWDLMLHKDDVYQRNSLMLCRHPALQARMRSILVDWLSEVSEVFRLHRETYYLAVDLIDRYLSYQSDIPKQQLQLIGITSLFISAKIEEIYPPKLSEFAYVTDGACTESEILSKELVILKALKWGLYPMTVNSWLTVYIQLYATLEKENASQRRSHNQNGDTFMIPNYPGHLFAQIAHLIDLCILDIGTLNFSYSVLAAAALYHFTNENIVQQCTGLQIDEIRECVYWMIPFALAIRDQGFDPKIMQKAGEESESLPNLLLHTVNLALLEKAHLKQQEQSYDDQETSSAASSLSSPLSKSKAEFLTPPRSSSKRSSKNNKKASCKRTRRVRN